MLFMGFHAKISKMRSWRVLVLIQVASLRSARQAHARKKICKQICCETATNGI